MQVSVVTYSVLALSKKLKFVPVASVTIAAHRDHPVPEPMAKFRVSWGQMVSADPL